MPRGGKGYFSLFQADLPGVQQVNLELPTLTCCHCGRIVVLNPNRQRQRNWCMKCDHYVCDLKFCIEDCNPIQQALELASEYDKEGHNFLGRGQQGEILFDPRLRDERKVY